VRNKNKGPRRNKIQRRDDKEVWKSGEGELQRRERGKKGVSWEYKNISVDFHFFLIEVV
jgi:hypothetical protein